MDSNLSDVIIVGAGPAGLMLADNLARFGVDGRIMDQRPDQTTAGRADGLQPKTIETLRMLRLADDLVRVSTKVYDICIWGRDKKNLLSRQRREIHYPRATVDVLDPYILLCHQGMVEGIFIKTLGERGVTVERRTAFERCEVSAGGVLAIYASRDEAKVVLKSKYLVGCDGAHSTVRKSIPHSIPEGTLSESIWGVIDGQLSTDFPDIWSKTIVGHAQHGTVLIIPRERGMTRFYIELKPSSSRHASTPGHSHVSQDTMMQRARQIMAPFTLDWITVEWFGCYQVGQRVASNFMDDARKIFIAGDASHTHSPKAAQGMNTSIHDAWNLAWKLNLDLRRLAKPILIESYEQERKKIARDLVSFDYEHANSIAAGDNDALAENFRTNIRFIAGVGVEYADNILTQQQQETLDPRGGALKPGSILPPAKVVRYIDHNPVDVQLDIPILGQFRVYVLVNSVTGAADKSFLQTFSDLLTSPTSFFSRVSDTARTSYRQKPRRQGREDVYFCHERYTSLSDLFTFSLITPTAKEDFEINRLPHLFSATPWAVYLDAAASMDTQSQRCISKWLGHLGQGDIAIVNVRPDNYVGSISRWQAGMDGEANKAAQWWNSYFEGFLKA